MITNYCRKSLVLYPIILLLVSSPMEARHKQQITGRVIAKDAYMGLAHVSSATHVELFIVKVDDAAKGTRSLRFIKVRYEDYADQHPLASELLEGKSHWTFSLTRDKSCDEVVSEDLFVAPSNSGTPPKAGTFILAQNAGQDVPAIKTTIPCFALRPGGVKQKP
jgi:hypothetical protein